MRCAACGTERGEPGARCPCCGAPAGEAATGDPQELVAVLRTSDVNLLPVIESVLAAAGIPHVVQGGESLGLFPLGPFGGGVMRRVLGASILVPRERAAEARELLAGSEEVEWPDEEDPDDER